MTSTLQAQPELMTEMGDAQAIPLFSMRPPTHDMPPHRGNGANVLLVDRHAATRKVLGNFLHEHGYRVWPAADADEAQSLLARQQMDLVTMDVLLPGGHAPDLIRRLRGDDTTATLPIVIISSLGSTRNVCSGLECGADDYIAKPVSLGIIAARLGAVLRRYGWNTA